MQFLTRIFEIDVRFGQKDSQECKGITNVPNKGLEILKFEGPLEHSSPFYKSSQILKIIDLIKLNIFFVYDQINNNLPNAFENCFQLKRQQHNHFTRGKILNVPQVKIHLSIWLQFDNSFSNKRLERPPCHGQLGFELIISPSISRGKVTSIIENWFLAIITFKGKYKPSFNHHQRCFQITIIYNYYNYL